MELDNLGLIIVHFPLKMLFYTSELNLSFIEFFKISVFGEGLLSDLGSH